MAIDIALGIVLLLALVKGYRQGIIMSVFTVSAFLAGFFASVHLSFLIARYISSSFNVAEEWLPVLAFIATFVMVLLMVRWMGKLLEKAISKLMLTLFNRLAGSALWALVVFLIISQLFYILSSGNIFSEALISGSGAAPYLEKAGIFLQYHIGETLPWLKKMYREVDEYFRGLADRLY